MIREAEIEAALCEGVIALGGEVRKVKWQGRRGAPDRAVFWPCGVVHWIELKSDTGRVSPSQAIEHAKLRKLGQQIYVLRGLYAVRAYLACALPT